MVETIFGNYFLFFLKTITIVIAIIIVLGVLFKSKTKSDDGKITITNLSEQLDEQKKNLEEELLGRKEYKKRSKDTLKKEVEDKPCVFVIEFNGDVAASQVDALRKEVSAVLTLATPNDEVLVKLESPGGSVYGYGLGASQLLRIKDKNIPLTIAVDKIAASGGYMMACVADKIVAAPFAVVGSIGVVAEVPNVHRLLKKHEIDVDVMTAGKYKRTVTLLGENTQEGKEKFQQELEEVHHLFKNFVQENRPIINIEQVSTGEAWYGTNAQSLNLIDEITTSDDLILKQIEQKKVVLVKFEEKKTLIKEVSGQIEKSAICLFSKLFNNRGTIR